MSSNFWSQWAQSDLDSWQGKDEILYEDEELSEDCEDEDDEEPEEEYGCSCGYHCMDCLGLSWRDFM